VSKAREIWLWPAEADGFRLHGVKTKTKMRRSESEQDEMTVIGMPIDSV
jgi:hypothetical protein